MLKKVKVPSNTPSLDITQRKRAEEVLKESEAKFKTIVENIRDVVFQLSPLGIIQYVSPKVQEVYGYKPEDLIGKHFKKTTSISELTKVLDALKSVLSGKVINNLEINQLDSKGKIVPMEINIAPVRREGKIIAVQGIMRDITERKRAEEALRKAHDELEMRVEERTALLAKANEELRIEIAVRKLAKEALRESEEKYKALFENLNDAAFLADVETGRILDTNKQGELLLGRTREEVIGIHQSQLHPPQKANEYRQRFLTHTQKGRTADFDGEAIRKDGSIVSVSISASPINIGGKELIVGLFRDITERKRAEQELESSREQLRILFEFAPDAYYLNDLKGNFVDGNKAAEEITGYKRDELIGKSFLKLKLLSPRQILKAAALLAKNALGQPTGPDEFTLNRKGGNQVPVEIRTFPVKIKGKTLVLGIARDITERKRAEERIEHLNAVLRAIRNVNQLIAREKDRDRLLKGTCDILIETRGYYNAWIVLLDESGGFSTHSQAGLGKEFLPMLERLKRGELPSCSRRVLRQSEVVVTKDPFSTCTDCPLADKYRGRGAMTVRLEYEEKVYGMLSVSIPRAPIADEEEQSLFREVASDIAFALHGIELEEKRKQMERELQERNTQLVAQQQVLIEKTEEVERANQLKSEFLANMSHELRTPLNVIIGFSELMMDKVPGDVNEEQRQCLSDILDSSHRLLNLINDVLDLSKIESGKVEFKLENVALDNVIESLTRTMMAILTPRKQSLDIDIEEGLPLVHVDEGKLRQVLLNLVTNSSKFTPDGGKLKIKTVREDNWCQVSVIDNGIGIKKEDQERIFEPFCWLDNPLTKEKSGTGLGLALVETIVEKYGGRIWVESKYGKGSRFTFTLPLATSG